MEGGVVLTNDEELYHIMLSIRAHVWTRNLPRINWLLNQMMPLRSHSDLYCLDII